VHAKAWKQTFDAFLAHRAHQSGESLAPFDADADYDEYVDGKPRYEGVQSFLRSRGIDLPQGDPDDPPGQDTIDAIGNRKNALVLALIHEQGVEPYPGSVAYLRAARDAGLRRAVVSSSTNCRDVLHAAGLIELVEEIVDGVVATREHLRGKPAPDTFLAAARAFDMAPAGAAVFEDALAGVAAGHAGSFGCVIGVDRVGQADALKAHGADLVVSDLSDLLPRA
jgi:HAD superfamily hydrolase (TIGR01509 family)